MADTWNIDPKNPDRITYTDPSGKVHEKFRKIPLGMSADEYDSFLMDESINRDLTPEELQFRKARSKPAPQGKGPAVTAPEMSWGQRFGEAYDRATSMAGTGEIGALSRGLEDLFNLDDRFQQAQGLGDAKAREDFRDQERVRKVREVRGLWAALDKADPNWKKDGTILGNVARFSASLLGDIAGNANPTYLIGGGSTVAERMAVQGAVNAGVDAAIQGQEINQGIEDGFDPQRAAMQFLAGTVIQGGSEVAGKAVKAIGDAVFPSSGVDVDLDIPAEDLPFERAAVQGDAAADIKGRWTKFWQQNEDYKAKTGQNAPNFDELSKEFEGLYRKYLPDEDFNPAWDPTTGPIVVEGSRTVKPDSGIGADVTFSDADEAFTNALINVKVEDPSITTEAPGNALLANDLERRAVPREATQAQKPVTRDVVENVVAEKTKTWKNAPEFEIVERADQIADPKMRAAVEDPSVIGFYGEDGKVRLISDNLRSKDEIAPALFHEALGHHGLAQEFGKNLDVMMQRLYDKTPELRKAVDDWRTEYGESYGDVPLSTQVEEVLAKMSEKEPLTRSVIDRVKDFIKNYARKIGIDLEYSDREIRSILAGAHQNVIRGSKTSETPSGTRFIRAYHVSPADFDKFDSRYVGTGEGAQAYGMGHYFTESPEVRDSYRDFFSKNELQINGRDVSALEFASILDDKITAKYPEYQSNGIGQNLLTTAKDMTYSAARLAKESGRVPDKMEILRKVFPDGNEPAAAGAAARMLSDTMREINWSVSDVKPKTYEVELPDEGNWVDRDAPIIEQPLLKEMFENDGFTFRSREELRALHQMRNDAHVAMREAENKSGEAYRAAAALYEKADNDVQMAIPDESIGHGVESILADHGLNDKQVADALKEAGFTGFKYKDGFSRAGKRVDPTYNYVVFDDDVPKITNKYMKRKPERPELKGDFDPDADINSSRELDRAIRELGKGVVTIPQTWAETDALAGEIGLKPSEVAKRQRIDIEEVPQLMQGMIATMERQHQRVSALAEKVRNGDDSSETLARAMKQVAVLADILPTVMRIRSASGRALNTFAQLSKEGRNPAEFLEALKDFGDDSLPVDKDSIIKLLTNLAELSPEQAARAANDAFKPRAEDVLFSLWYNIDLLSRPSTQYNNFMGTLENVLFETGAKALATPAGQVRKLMGKTDRVAVREVLARVFGAGTGALQGIMNAPKAFRMAMPVTGVSKEAYRPAPIFDIAKDVTKNAPAAVKYPALGVAGTLEATSRVMAMADEFFRAVSHNSELWGQAVRKALDDNGPEPFAEKVYTYSKNPTEKRIPQRRLDKGLDSYNDPLNEERWKIYDEAKTQADINTFRDMSSPIMKRYEDVMRPKPDDSIGARTGRFALRVLVPFARMGDAMTRSKIRMTPIIGFLDRYNKADWAAGGARRDVVLGRMAIGLGLGALAAQQTLNGERSGNGPADYERRMEMEASGWKPNAVRQEDGSWAGKQGLGAVNTYMNTVASLTEALAGEEITQKDYDKKILEAFGAVMASFTKDAGVENLVNIISAEPDTSALTNSFGGILSSFASPGFVQSYNQYIGDTKVRSAVDKDAPSSGKDRTPRQVIAGRTRAAWGDQGLPQKYDIYGRGKERPGGWLNMLSGGRYGTPETDKAVLELARLAKGQDKALVDQPEKTLTLGSGDDKVTKKLTEGEFQKYTGLSGYYLREIFKEQMGTPEFKSMSDDDKRKLVKEIKKFARKAAREQLFIERDEEPPEAEEPYVEEEAVIE